MVQERRRRSNQGSTTAEPDMPTILVKIPKGSFPGNSRATLVRRINEVAAEAEQMPGDPRTQALCWVLVDEVDAGGWTCGGVDLTAKLLPCVVRVYVPAGVLHAASRRLYVERLHAAFEASRPEGDTRRVTSSIVLHDVPDGTWGANGALWTLPDFTRASGYAHLQHLVAA
jgi:phenylpyruvate tautomerase PptA (4-oxalocrotonate tautomerase family)